MCCVYKEKRRFRGCLNRGSGKFICGLSVASKRLNRFCKCFDEELWTALLDYTTVYTKDDIRFILKAENEVKDTG